VVSMVVEEIAEGGGHLKWADSGTPPPCSPKTGERKGHPDHPPRVLIIVDG
jgi:hypothetical protein